MTINRTRMSEQSSGQQGPTIADLIDRLSRFDGPPDQFLVNLLAVQCAIGWASGGSYVRSASGQPEVLAVYPPMESGSTAPVWLSQAVESLGQLASNPNTLVKPLRQPDELYGAPPDKFLILLPIRSGQGVRGVAAFLVENADGELLQASRQRLELTLSLLSLYEMRLTLQHRQFDLQRLRQALEVLSAVNDHEKFAAVGMSLCNEISSRWQCNRVSLGFLKGRYVHLKALSHTEKFSRKMKLVQNIESAMEECLDQDVETVYPLAADATYVGRATEELSRQQGPSAILSLPLRRAGEVIGVLTLERPIEKPFTLDEVESLRLTADLATARVNNLFEHDRWIGARAAASVRKGAGMLVGAKHTWIKLIAIAVLALTIFLIFAKGDYQAEGPFTIQAVQRQVVAAPYDANLEQVFVDVGQPVKAGETVLAKLRTEEFEKELSSAKEELKKDNINASAAWAASVTDDKKRAEALGWQAQANAAADKIALLEGYIADATIKAKIDGIVVAGDLRQQLNWPFKKGDVMFEVAPLDALRAEISIPEDQITDVNLEKTGELMTRSQPDRRIQFTLERINPVAEPVNQNNVFKVRAKLKDVDLTKDYTWLKPGMEGVAKINIDRRNYGFLWTRRLVNWLRMQLWF